MKSKSMIPFGELLKVLSTLWNPHAYQKKAVQFLLKHAAAALFLDPGLGKTSIVLAAIKLLIKAKIIQKVLIIAPVRVCHSVWPGEQQKWKDFHGLRMVVLHGPKKDELLKLDADIFVINPEGLNWLLQAKVTKTGNGKISAKVDFKRWKALGFDTLVIDELSRFKHSNTVKFKGLSEVLNTFQRRWGLTGSPAANGLMDLFGQCYVLDQGRTLGQYITHYRRQYFLPGYDGFSWVLREGADQEIYKRLKPLALRMDADDYLTLPKLIENDIRLDMNPEAFRVYLELERDLVAQIGAGKVTAATAATASMKLRQVANGGAYLDQEVLALVQLPKSKREWVNLDEGKAEAVAELVEELQGSPLLVAYDFQHDLDRLRKHLGDDIPYIGGGVSPKKSKEYERLWNAGKLPILAGHPQSIALGLNLQEMGNHVCWHSLTWDYELYDQLIRRVRRQGNTHKHVFVHRLISRGTVDEEMLISLMRKERGQQALFKALKSIKRK